MTQSHAPHAGPFTTMAVTSNKSDIVHWGETTLIHNIERQKKTIHLHFTLYLNVGVGAKEWYVPLYFGVESFFFDNLSLDSDTFVVSVKFK